MMKKRIMKTAKLLKEEISNPNIWKLILINLGLPLDLDEITVTAIKEPNNDNG